MEKPFYLTGQLDGKPLSVHREGDGAVTRRAGEDREPIELVEPADDQASAGEASAEEPPRPVCPNGTPNTGWDAPDAPPPGVSLPRYYQLERRALEG